MSQQSYIGTELDVFADAHNWKAYLRRLIDGHLCGRVLEVGAGIGGTTAIFRNGRQTEWTALEPDPQLAERLRTQSRRFEFPIDVVVGTVESADLHGLYDCVLYIDVLEHIRDDREELARAAALLNAAGTVVVLSPAHQALYTPFDKAIGHYRRYNRTMLQRLTPNGTELVRLQYVDSVGVLLSAANRLLLHSSSPTASQVQFWDKRVVPASRWLDRLLGGRVGKSILAVWRRSA